jgi:heme-degrading monooxygenase HmoA
MVVTCNRLYVNPDYAEQFEARFRDRAGLVETRPGFVSFQLLRPTKEGDPYIAMTHWATMEQFRAWVDSDEFKQGHGQSGTLPPEAYTQRPQLEIFEVV